MTLLERVHEARIVGRRARVLAAAIAPLLPRGASVLDIGCGDGLVAWSIARSRPDIAVAGLEVQPRPGCLIPVRSFEGRRLPYGDCSFAVVMLVDVLHHAVDASTLLGEAARVSCGSVILKDHVREGLLAAATLRFMDRVGNRRRGVAVPGVYWDRARWREELRHAGLEVKSWQERLGLYPWPVSLVFERRLHVLALLAAGRSVDGGTGGV